ncbi:MAG TPA: hypothetical protein VKP66_20790 [Steroidobacteraceae bacterium]|nr:hypothetical protein [Steroidobacteraceae bacterium]
MTQSLAGPFSATQLHAGLWRLAADAPDGVRVYLRGADSEASTLLAARHVAALEIEWRNEGAMVEVTGAEGVRRFRSESVFIHTPMPRLYDELPLARFDANAQRFWRRVFRLMRIPGGRLLVGAIARRRRGTASH